MLGGIVVRKLLQAFLLFRLVSFVLGLDQLHKLEKVVFADEWFFYGGVVPFEANVKDVEAEFEEIRHLDLFALNLDVYRLDKNIEKHLSKLRRIKLLQSKKL